ARRLHLLEVEHLAVVEDAEMRRLAGVGCQPLEIRTRSLAETEAGECLGAEFEEANAEPVLAALCAALEQTVPLEHHQQPMDRALVEAQPFGELEERQVFVVRGQR